MISKSLSFGYCRAKQDKNIEEIDELVDILAPAKYYFEDIGLRNTRLNFRQLEEPHLMENIIIHLIRQTNDSPVTPCQGDDGTEHDKKLNEL